VNNEEGRWTCGKKGGQGGALMTQCTRNRERERKIDGTWEGEWSKKGNYRHTCGSVKEMEGCMRGKRYS